MYMYVITSKVVHLQLVVTQGQVVSLEYILQLPDLVLLMRLEVLQMPGLTVFLLWEYAGMFLQQNRKVIQE